ncbi:MAG: hypothetical protein ABL901_10155 [Hyphomicrobiaceae bacterium]
MTIYVVTYWYEVGGNVFVEASSPKQATTRVLAAIDNVGELPKTVIGHRDRDVIDVAKADTNAMGRTVVCVPSHLYKTYESNDHE